MENETESNLLEESKRENYFKWVSDNRSADLISDEEKRQEGFALSDKQLEYLKAYEEIKRIHAESSLTENPAVRQSNDEFSTTLKDYAQSIKMSEQEKQHIHSMSKEELSKHVDDRVYLSETHPNASLTPDNKFQIGDGKSVHATIEKAPELTVEQPQEIQSPQSEENTPAWLKYDHWSQNPKFAKVLETGKAAIDKYVKESHQEQLAEQRKEKAYEMYQELKDPSYEQMHASIQNKPFDTVNRRELRDFFNTTTNYETKMDYRGGMTTGEMRDSKYQTPDDSNNRHSYNLEQGDGYNQHKEDMNRYFDPEFTYSLREMNARHDKEIASDAYDLHQDTYDANHQFERAYLTYQFQDWHGRIVDEDRLLEQFKERQSVVYADKIAQLEKQYPDFKPTLENEIEQRKGYQYDSPMAQEEVKPEPTKAPEQKKEISPVQAEYRQSKTQAPASQEKEESPVLTAYRESKSQEQKGQEVKEESPVLTAYRQEKALEQGSEHKNNAMNNIYQYREKNPGIENQGRKRRHEQDHGMSMEM